MVHAFLGNYTVPIEEQDIDAKIRSIACFKSQQHRVYSSVKTSCAAWLGCVAL